MNLPNKITVFRMCMVPVFVVLMLVDTIPYNNVIAAVVFVVAALSDAVDGHLARKLNLVSNFGKFMDPLADKLLVCSALICFLGVEGNPMPVWVVIVIIGREFVISGFRLVASDAGVVIAANYWGKIKTVVQMVMSVFLIVNFSGTAIDYVELVLIYASATLAVISLITYIADNYRVILDENM